MQKYSKYKIQAHGLAEAEAGRGWDGENPALNQQMVRLTRMHSSRMRTVRSSSCLLSGGDPHPPRSRPPPRAGTPWEQTPLEDGKNGVKIVYMTEKRYHIVTTVTTNNNQLELFPEPTL